MKYLLLFIFILFVSCASTPQKIDREKLFAKTWIHETTTSLEDGSAQTLSQKTAYKLTADSLNIANLCRYLDANGSDVKSFFVSASGASVFNPENSTLEIKEKISKMESERVRDKKSKNHFYYTCEAEMAKGVYELSYDTRSGELVLRPHQKKLILKEQ